MEKLVSDHKRKYFAETGTMPQRKKNSMFNKICEFLNTHESGELLSSADIRNATGANSERLCYILGGLRLTGNVERVTRGIYKVKHRIPGFVTSCIVEGANKGYGFWSTAEKKYYQTSPKWKVGDSNPWFKWYGFDNKENLKEIAQRITSNPIASEIELPRTKDGVIFAVTGESKNAKETLEELMERTKNPKKFNVERVDINHVKVTLDGGSSFFFPNSQWDLIRKYVLNSHYGSMDQARVRYEERQLTPMFKAKPGDLLFYIDENKVCSADLLEIKFRWTKDQKKVTTYTTIHGTYSEDRVFASKEELIKSL